MKAPPPGSISRLRLALLAILELPIRLAAWTLTIAGYDTTGIEAALRGYVLGGRRKLRIGRNVQFEGRPDRFRLGDRVALWGNVVLNANGPAGYVHIGGGSHVDHFSVLYGQGGLEIGCYCAIASGSIIYSQSNQDLTHDGTPVVLQAVRYAPVRLGRGCWLGAGARILPGVNIGEGVHVGAGAVVTRTIAPFSVVVGVPGRVVRNRLANAVVPIPQSHHDRRTGASE